MLMTLTFSTVFLFIPDTGPDRFKKYEHEGKIITIDTHKLPDDSEKIAFFPFSSKKLFKDTYVFLLFVHVIELFLSIVIVILEKEYKSCAQVYLTLVGADLLFYVLSYGEPLRDYNLTWNVIKIGGFILSIALSTWKPLKTKSAS